MAFNIPQPGGFDEASIKGELEKKVMEGLGVDSSLEEWATVRDESDAQDVEDKDDFEAKLMQIRPNDWKDFVLADGKINIEYLKDKLTGKEKLSMLASHIIGDQLFNIFFPGKKDGVRTLSMDEAADYFARNPDKGARKLGQHLVWDQSTFGQIQTLFSLADLVTEKSEEDKEAFPLIPGTFWFVNMAPPEGGPKLRPTMYSVLKRACERVGVKLTFLRPGEKPIEAPKLAEKEIKLSFMNPQSIPLKTDGTVDLDLLDWYVECYDKAPCMIMQGNPLIAAILKRKGETTAAAVSKGNANLEGQGWEEVLNSILKKGETPAAPVEAPKKHLLPMQGDKVDRAGLDKYYRQFKDPVQKEYLEPVQLAACAVLDGAEVGQALKYAKILETDPNYATLKTDLESLAKDMAGTTPSAPEEPGESQP